jgi:hypothetical protein
MEQIFGEGYGKSSIAGGKMHYLGLNQGLNVHSPDL